MPKILTEEEVVELEEWEGKLDELFDDTIPEYTIACLIHTLREVQKERDRLLIDVDTLKELHYVQDTY